MDFTRQSVAGAAAVIAFSVPLIAQDSSAAAGAHGRSGFYGSLGLAFGSSTTQLSGYFGADGGPASAQAAAGGMSLSLSLGAAVSSHWRVGGQVDFTRSDYPSSSYSLAGKTSDALFVTGAVSFYPSLSNGLWVRANLGFTRFEVHTTVGGGQGGPSSSTTGTEGAAAAGLGIGYDWHPGSGPVMIVPFASYMAPLSGVAFSGPMNGWHGRMDLLQVGIGIGYSH